jgi:hypothetical protein
MKVSVPIVCLAALALAACSGGSSEQLAAVASPAAAAKTAEPPDVPAGNRRPSSAAKNVAQMSNATTVSVAGTLEAHQEAEFVVSEERGALFLVHALTPGADVDISVYRGDTGERVPDQHPKNPTLFAARMPETMAYLIVVRGMGTASPFRLDLENPRRLFFDEKTGAAEVKPAIPAHATVAYIVPPSQTITAEITNGANDAYLMVQDLTGKPLLKAERAARKFAGPLPDTGDAIVVSINQGSSDGEVGLKVYRK